MLDLLKKWVAKGVASEVYDFTSQERIEFTKVKELQRFYCLIYILWTRVKNDLNMKREHQEIYCTHNFFEANYCCGTHEP